MTILSVEATHYGPIIYFFPHIKLCPTTATPNINSHTLHSNFHTSVMFLSHEPSAINTCYLLLDISPYRTLAVVELQSMEVMSYTL